MAMDNKLKKDEIPDDERMETKKITETIIKRKYDFFGRTVYEEITVYEYS